MGGEDLWSPNFRPWGDNIYLWSGLVTESERKGYFFLNFLFLFILCVTTVIRKHFLEFHDWNIVSFHKQCPKLGTKKYRKFILFNLFINVDSIFINNKLPSNIFVKVLWVRGKQFRLNHFHVFIYLRTGSWSKLQNQW